MKMTFTGWSRTMYTHPHEVQALSDGYRRYPVKKIGEPLEWDSALSASGKVTGLQLGGDFRVKFDFSDAELRNWLSKYIEEKPAVALRLLSEMQAEAIIALNTGNYQESED